MTQFFILTTVPGAGVINASIHTTLTAKLLSQNIGIPSSDLQVILFAACRTPPHMVENQIMMKINIFHIFHSMARREQIKKVKPDMASSPRKFINKAKVKRRIWPLPWLKSLKLCPLDPVRKIKRLDYSKQKVWSKP